MRVLFINPGALPHVEIFLRLEPLGLECVAEEARRAGHQVLLDLQVHDRHDYERLLIEFRPEAVGISLNYLANVPEVLELIASARARLPSAFLFVGGHIASFIPEELLEHAGGALDCVVRGGGRNGDRAAPCRPARAGDRSAGSGYRCRQRAAALLNSRP